MIPKTITGFCPVLNKPYCVSAHYHHVHSNEGDDYYIKGNFLCLHKKYGGKVVMCFCLPALPVSPS